MLYKNAVVFIDDSFKKGGFRVENGIFTEVYEGNPYAGENGVDLAGQYVIPGLIDVHTHGNSGEDFSDGSYEGIIKMASYNAHNGITSFAPTSMTLPYETLAKAFDGARRFKESSHPGCARLAGIHMEGPFFSMAKKGAQNGDYLKLPDIEAFKKLYNGCKGLVKIVDLAPELEGSADFVKEASKYCTVSIAHSDATYEDATAAIKAGVTHITHMYNAMPPIHHRKPGVIGAASENEQVRAELICDGFHVHPSSIRMAFRLFPGRICLISDSLRCCGMPDGEYELGGQQVFLKGGVARLADGTLAGSASNVYQCMLNVISYGIPREEAILAATRIPAEELHMENEIGSIKEGLKADFVVCGPALTMAQTYIGGTLVQ